MSNLRLRFEQWLTNTTRPMNSAEAEDLFEIFEEYLEKEVCLKCEKIGYQKGYQDGKEHGLTNGFEMGYDSVVTEILK